MADRQETDRNGMAESNDSGALGNRPATGARLVDNASGLASSFGGGQEATDFLGLSQELGGLEPDASDLSAPTALADAGAPSGADPSASWLLSQGEQAAAEEELAEEATEEEEEAPVETGRSRRILSVAAAILVIGAAVTVAMKFSASKETPALLTAQHPAPKHTPPANGSELSASPTGATTGRETILPNGETVPVTPTPVVETSTTETETVATTTPEIPDTVPATTETEVAVEPPAAPRLGGKRLEQWMSTHGWSPSEASDADPESAIAPTPAGWASTAALAFAGRSSGLPAGEAVAQENGEWVPDGGNLPQAAVTLANGEVVGGAAPANAASGTAIPAFSLRMASQEDLAGIWKASAVPMDLLDSETRIMTPAVGAVRVVLKTGEIFDGRLYAVGQGQVWLESDIGRLAVAAKHVLRIDQSVVEKDSKAVDSLPRMRVRTPGGLFFGKVLSRDDVHVTLLLDGGGRITLESADVEAAPLGDTRLIGPVKPH
jgi:hypothetical protein